MFDDHWTSQSRVRAVLGPTNTGKTYTAIQRMLGHRNGIFGLPLRLLAREVYDRVVDLKGAESVALITGEEKIVPVKPRYYICTTESMPQDLPVEFVAVDEVQLAAHPQRGHVFTDRILHARGSKETLFLGSKTIEALLTQLVPGIDIEEKPRLSELKYSGYRKLTNLPPRSAVVEFSAERVVALAERLRVKYGGTAIVTGALSPRSRNAQVALYENGDVDYLVATDAIGMGLNLNVHHIALANDWKFDGKSNRPLRSDELAQIAGRAGRFRRNGTFGTTDQLQSLQTESVEAVCSHTFEPLQRVYWRSSQLNFSSVDALLASLDQGSRQRILVQKRDADDQLSLERLAIRTRIRDRAHTADTVQLLWDVCGIPDFSNALPAYHSEFLALVFHTLLDHQGLLPEPFVAERVQRLDRDDGNIETLMARIGAIRTWTFLANRGEWLRDPVMWQEKTQGIEDKISDALHLRLTERFVDRRSSVLKRWVPNEGTMTPDVDVHGRVTVAGQVLAELVGLDVSLHGANTVGEHLEKAIRQCLLPLVQERVGELLQDPDTALRWKDGCAIEWRGGVVARLRQGSDVLHPKIVIYRSDWLDGHQRSKLHTRLQRWINEQMNLWREFFIPSEFAGPAERAILYGLEKGNGWVAREDLPEMLKQLSKRARNRLKRQGVLFGPTALCHPLALTENRAKIAFWAATEALDVRTKQAPSIIVQRSKWPDGLLQWLGYSRVGRWAIRRDVLERYTANKSQSKELFGEYEQEIIKALTGGKGRSKRRRR